MNILKSLLITSMAMISVAVNAQSISIDNREGKVSKEEIQMSGYPLDTSANAVVLYKSCDLSMEILVDMSLSRQEKHYSRVKILKTDGKSHGDFEVQYYSNEDSNVSDKIENIKVTTWNLENGKVVTSRLDKKSIFDEKLDSRTHVKKFSAPNVKEGSVVEVSYSTSSDRYWNFDNYYLQDDIPVNEAEYSLLFPSFFVYNKRTQGYCHIESKAEEKNGAVALPGGNMSITRNYDSYRAVDLPAVKEEPYAYDISQYMAGVIYNLIEVDIPGMTPALLATSWRDVDRNLLDDEMLESLTASDPVQDKTKAIMARNIPDEDKIVQLWTVVKDLVKWDGRIAMYPNSNPKKTIKDGSGSNADINALLACILSDAGFKVKPVMVRLRTSGLLLMFSPSLNAYDTFILQVATSKGTVHYIDASGKGNYLDVLPPEYLVEKARVLDKNGCEWVDLRNLAQNWSNHTVEAKVSPDGTIAGTISSKFGNGESCNFKSDYFAAGSESDFISAYEKDNSLKLSDPVISGIDSISPGCSFTSGFETEANVSGDYIYITPMVLKLFSSSLFKNTERKIPIDFPYAYSTKYILILTVPEGYEIDQIPKKGVYTFQDLGSQHLVNSQISGGNKVIFNVTFRLGALMSEVADYPDIRRYWNTLSDSENEMIVLKKKAE